MSNRFHLVRFNFGTILVFGRNSKIKAKIVKKEKIKKKPTNLQDSDLQPIPIFHLHFLHIYKQLLVPKDQSTN
jgi:hypothetical protein